MRVIVSLSGGMDSTALLGAIREEFPSADIMAVSFQYPSKHNRYELHAAQNVAAFYGVSHRIIDASSVYEAFKSDLLESGGDIPEGHYTDESMKATVVPCRNMIFASIIAGLADSMNYDIVALGIHSGDHAIYPDCRPDFFRKLGAAASAATERRVTMIAPFLTADKTLIIKKASTFKIQVPWNLTRTCYKNQSLACGKCGSCVERLEAFKNNGMVDPVPYENSMS